MVHLQANVPVVAGCQLDWSPGLSNSLAGLDANCYGGGGYQINTTEYTSVPYLISRSEPSPNGCRSICQKKDDNALNRANSVFGNI